MEANLTALRVLRRVQAEDRAATLDEQHLLARWGGWGAQGVWQVLDSVVEDGALSCRSRCRRRRRRRCGICCGCGTRHAP